jgi:MFS family permease
MNNAAAPNARRLLLVGFFAIFAAGVGFSVRGAALVHWATAYNFTQTELGGISGGGLWAMGIIFILGSIFADKVGYGRLMVMAVIAHLLSAGLQLCTDQVYGSFPDQKAGQEAVKLTLTAAMILFAVGNGICEVVVNPMVATLFPNNKTHYLNILHAGWPGGLVTGGVITYIMDKYEVYWMIQMSMFLIPVAIYALLMFGQHMPRSEASEAGVPFMTNLKEFLAPMLLLLLLIHAMVGYVELGSDSWMQDILNRIRGKGIGTLIFIYTSILMFTLRFFGGPIEHRLSPLGLLFSSAVIATIGLTLFNVAPKESLIFFIVAATVYGIGKTFFWPTMLAVVSERFPRGGALTLGTVGGVGMLSAGLLGAPSIGFKQDYYAAAKISEPATKDVYDRYAAEKPHKSPLDLFEVKGLDVAKTNLLALDRDIQATENPKKKGELQKEMERRLTQDPGLKTWWEVTPDAREYANRDSGPINDAEIYGGQMALGLTAVVPAMMAVLYLLLILYFRFTGGYKRLVIEAPAPQNNH